MKPLYVSIIIVLVAVGAFLGGMEYQKKQTAQVLSSSGRQMNGSQFATRGQFQRGNAQGLRPVSGEIISQDDKSLTVKLQDGSSKIVLLSDTTVINKAEHGAKSDLKTGEKVAAFGKENPDGSVTAQNIQLNPPQRMMGLNSNQPEPTNN